MQRKRIAVACLLAIAVVPVVANAEAVTYDFTGTVSSSSGIYAVGDGTTVTGTYTIDYTNANPTQSSGTVGSTTADWIAENEGGGSSSTLAPTLAQYVFASTLQSQSGSVSYSTNPAAGGWVNESFVETGLGGPALSATELSQSPPASLAFTKSSITLVGSGGSDPWTSSGGLVLLASGGISNAGYVEYSVNGVTQGQLDYVITSLTPAPVPLPAAGWLLLAGLGGLGAMTRKRQAS